jgi:hypothetical protein
MVQRSTFRVEKPQTAISIKGIMSSSGFRSISQGGMTGIPDFA